MWATAVIHCGGKGLLEYQVILSRMVDTFSQGILSGYSFQFGIIRSPFLERGKPTVRQAYPAVVPIAHVISPYQLCDCHLLRVKSPVQQILFHPSPHALAQRVVVAPPSGAVHALLYFVPSDGRLPCSTETAVLACKSCPAQESHDTLREAVALTGRF